MVKGRRIELDRWENLNNTLDFCLSFSQIQVLQLFPISHGVYVLFCFCFVVFLFTAVVLMWILTRFFF